MLCSARGSFPCVDRRPGQFCTLWGAVCDLGRWQQPATLSAAITIRLRGAGYIRMNTGANAGHRCHVTGPSQSCPHPRHRGDTVLTSPQAIGSIAIAIAMLCCAPCMHCMLHCADRAKACQTLHAAASQCMPVRPCMLRMHYLSSILLAPLFLRASSSPGHTFRQGCPVPRQGTGRKRNPGGGGGWFTYQLRNQMLGHACPTGS